MSPCQVFIPVLSGNQTSCQVFSHLVRYSVILSGIQSPCQVFSHPVRYSVTIQSLCQVFSPVRKIGPPVEYPAPSPRAHIERMKAVEGSSEAEPEGQQEPDTETEPENEVLPQSTVHSADFTVNSVQNKAKAISAELCFCHGLDP